MALTIMGLNMFTSCGSMARLANDPDFQEGFRQGWNMTAPEEYRY